MIECYVKGAVAGVRGDNVEDNPHRVGTKAHGDWLVGHSAGAIAEKRRVERLPLEVLDAKNSTD